MLPEAVIDTNVVIAGLRSRNGASHQLLHRLESGLFVPVLSYQLDTEYESVGRRVLVPDRMPADELENAIDVFAARGRCAEVYFRLRPFLPDPGDDLVLELAFAAGSVPVVTFNEKHFRGADRYGVKVFTPAAFLHQTGG